MWVDAVMPIIVSPLLLSVWITMERRRRSNFQIVFVTSIVGGAIYALIEFCYECLTSTVYYFIHEAFLGSVLIALVGLLWTISKLDRITINKVELEF